MIPAQPTEREREKAREMVMQFDDSRLPGEYWHRLTQAIAQALADAREAVLDQIADLAIEQAPTCIRTIDTPRSDDYARGFRQGIKDGIGALTSGEIIRALIGDANG